MPRRPKGPRLYFRPARRDASGNITHAGLWFIRDGTSVRGTGLSSSASPEETEKALANYLAAKHTQRINSGVRDPVNIPVADVLTKYLLDIVDKHARPEETKARIRFLRAYWGGRRLSEVTGDTCRAYAATRSTLAAARRELEDLRSAINHHRREGLHDKIVSVILPERSQSRERWLTRSEAAGLILAAWRYREVQNLRGTDRRTRRHIARFMLVASYMGSRAGVICSASIEPVRPLRSAWIDLKHGVFYGRPVGQRETKKKRQTVQVPRRLLPHLRRWQAQGQRFVVEWLGKPVSRINKAHNAVVASAGLGPDVTPHVWRHTAATWLMQRGTPLWEAAGYLGMTAEVLERVYGHHIPNPSSRIHRRR